MPLHRLKNSGTEQKFRKLANQPVDAVRRFKALWVVSRAREAIADRGEYGPGANAGRRRLFRLIGSGDGGRAFIYRFAAIANLIARSAVATRPHQR